MNYEVKGPDGGVTGPFEEKVILEWIRAGQLPRQAEVRVAGTAGWIPVEMLDQFRGAFKAKSGGSSSKMIPTGNPAALWAYYGSLVSCFPVIGLPVAVFALMMAFRGWKAYQADPGIHGKGHLITAFICGGIGLVINLVMVGLMLVNLGKA